MVGDRITSSGALFVLSLCTTLSACKGPESKKEGPAASGSAAEASTGEAQEKTAQSNAAPPPAAVAAAGELIRSRGTQVERKSPEVWGHFALANLSKSLTTAKLWAPDQYKGFLDEAALKSLVSLQLGDRAAVAVGMKLDQAAGCVFVNPKKFEQPLSCLIHYEGGFDKLVSDLGPRGKLEDAKGHSGAYTVQGETVFLDKLGDAIVVSSDPSLFALTKDDLSAVFIEEADKIVGDLELVGAVQGAMKAYDKEIQELLDASEQQPPSADLAKIEDAELRKAVEAFYKAQSRQDWREQLEGIEQISLHLHLGPEASAFSVGGVGSAEAPMLKYQARGTIDRSLIDKLPADSAVAMTALTAADTHKNPTTQAQLRQFVAAWAELRGIPEAKAQAQVDAWMQENSQRFEPRTAAALLGGAEQRLGLIAISQLASGASHRDWTKWSKELKPSDVLGSKMAEYLNWTIEVDQRTLGPAKVDRWQVEPSEKARQEIEASLSGEKEKQDFARVFGDAKLTVERLRLDTHAIFTVTLGDADRLSQQALDAYGGKNSLAGSAHVDAIFARAQNPSMVMGVDPSAVRDWVSTLPEADEALSGAPKFNSSLADLFLLSRTWETGFAGGLGLQKSLVDQLAASGAKAAGPAQP